MLSKEQIDSIEEAAKQEKFVVDRAAMAELIAMARGALRVDEYMAEQQKKFTDQVKSPASEQTRVRDLERWLLKEQGRRSTIAAAARAVLDSWDGRPLMVEADERKATVAIDLLRKAIG